MNYLDKLLRDRNITKKNLANRICVVPSTITYYTSEKNKKPMRIDLAYDIATVLDIPIGEFIKNILNEREEN